MKKIFMLIIYIVVLLSCRTLANAKSGGDDTAVVGAWDKLYILKTDGALYSATNTVFWHESIDKDVSIDFEPTELKITKVMDNVAGVTSNYILQEDGRVINIETGNLIIEDAIKISESSSHLLIIKKDHTLWGLGNNSRGQLAQGEIEKSVEEQIAENLTYNNKTRCTPDVFDEPVKIMDGVKAALAYESRSLVLKDDDTVWTFGYDYNGSLGRGYRYIVNNVPVQILSNIKQIFAEYDACLAIDNDNMLWKWGEVYTRNDGNDGHFDMVPQKYVEGASFVANLPGFNLGYYLIVKTNGELWVCGDTNHDTANYPFSKTPVKLSDDVSAVWYAGSSTDDMEETVLVLKNNRDLWLMTVPDSYNSDQITFEKITGNVRLRNDDILTSKSFTDISQTPEETQKSINSLTKAEIISGTSETEFSPDKPITRAEIAALLLRMTAKADEEGSGGFEDVTEKDWYYNTAGASKKYNIVAGFDDNTFRGNDIISKAQLIALVARTLRNEGHATETEKGITNSEIPDWAEADISLALQEGLISETDLVDLNSDMTRADAAVILYRLYGKI